MRKIVAFLCSLFFFILTGIFFTPFRVDAFSLLSSNAIGIFVQPEYFQWKYNPLSDKETGFIWKGGITLAYFDTPADFTGYIRFFGLTGSTSLGSTSYTYRGHGFDGECWFRIYTYKDYTFGFTGGIGALKRNKKDNHGRKEEQWFFYAKAGGGVEKPVKLPFSGKNGRVYVFLGAKYPFLIGIDTANANYEPKGGLSGYIKAGVKYHKLQGAIYFDRTSIKESEGGEAIVWTGGLPETVKAHYPGAFENTFGIILEYIF